MIHRVVFEKRMALCMICSGEATFFMTAFQDPRGSGVLAASDGT